MSDVLATRQSRAERDEQAFRSFFVVEYPTVISSLTEVAGDRAAAESAAREAFTRLLVSWRRVRFTSSPGSWVLRQARRCLPAAELPLSRADVPFTPPTPSEVDLALAGVVASAHRRRGQRRRVLVGVASAAALVVAGLVAISAQDVDRPVPQQPLVPRRSTELGPPPWVTEPSFARAAAIARVYEPSPLDGHWATRVLTPGEVRRLLPGEVGNANLQLRLVVRSTAMSLWVGERSSPDQRLLSYESFGTQGQQITVSPVGHSRWHTIYRWQLRDGRLKLTVVGSKGTDPPSGEPIRHALHTTAAFTRR